MPRSTRSPALRFLASVLLSAGLLLAAGSALALPGDRSPDGVWRETTPATLDFSGTGTTPAPTLNAHVVFDIDLGALDAILAQVPPEALGATQVSAARLTLPMRDGSYQWFDVTESPVFTPELAGVYPQIRSFIAQGTDDRSLTAHFVQTPAGFYGFIRTLEGMIYMEPNGLGNTTQSIAYTRRDFSGTPAFDCGVGGEIDGGDLTQDPAPSTNPALIGLDAPSGATLSTYRLAVSATGEFTRFFDPLPAGGTANTLSQIAASVTAVNAIYRPEVTIRFQVSCNNVFEDPDTDPFTSADNSSPSLGHNQTSTDAECGSDNYDIGHVFHRRSGTGFSGLASGSVVCVDGSKARGYSSVPNPVPTNMIWIVDQLAHEIGHQFSAAHTFNSDVTGCAGNRAAGSAYEPGSGSTIMAYAAGTRCDFDFPGTNDAYFHGHSFDQITTYRDGGGNCAVTSNTGNTPPTVNAGPNYTIPQGTPFRLTAVGNDADGDPLTYCWEQFDLGDPGDLATNVNGPLFRSRPPITSPTRVFPIMEDILSGAATPTEILPLVNRTLNFRCTVRDNRVLGGGVNNDAMVLTIAGSPFFVTSPNGGETLTADCLSTVTWTVGGGDVAATVNILLSTNGGTTFDMLAAGVANDGSHEVRLPCTTTSQGRIMVEAVGNIFFDVSDANFTIANTAPNVAVEATGGDVGAACSFEVPYSAVITDACRVDASTVAVQAISLDGFATVGAPTVNVNVVGDDEVQVSGTVLVSALTGCPAQVRITVSAEDECGLLGSQSTDVEVTDDTPPEIEVTLSATHLWPPNHKLVPITAQVTTSDNCDGTTWVLTSITSNEPVNDIGDGDTAPDVVGAEIGTADTEFMLRAERSGLGTGRIYTVTYTATDVCGNSTSAQAEVRVNHSQAGKMFAAVGFTPSGDGFDPDAALVAVVVPGAADEELRQGFKHPSDVQTPEAPGMGDAGATGEMLGVLLGNDDGTAGALDVIRLDADGDGIEDHLLVFAGSTVRGLAAASAQPIGLHYATAPRQSFVVNDLLGLGPAMALSAAARTRIEESAAALAALDETEGRTADGGSPGAASWSEPVRDLPAPTASVPVTRFGGAQPNPFRGTTAFAYELATPGHVEIAVYSASGRLVRVVERSTHATGRFVRTWDGRDAQGRPMPPGIYVVRFTAPGVEAAGKTVLLR
jgi:hypothetical protein